MIAISLLFEDFFKQQCWLPGPGFIQDETIPTFLRVRIQLQFAFAGPDDIKGQMEFASKQEFMRLASMSNLKLIL